MKITVKAKTKRGLFIVAPTDAGVALGDTLHLICRKTKMNLTAFDAYQADKYYVLASTGSLQEANTYLKKHWDLKKPQTI